MLSNLQQKQIKLETPSKYLNRKYNITIRIKLFRQSTKKFGKNYKSTSL